MMNRQLLRTMEMVRLFSSPQLGHSPRYSKRMGQVGALLVNRQMTPLVIKLNVMPESESDNGLPETQSKRKASEMDFEIPPAKRTEPAEGSTTESESDSDVLHSTRTPASTLISASSKGTITPLSLTKLCSPWLVLGGRKYSPVDDSVTESESEDEHFGEAVRICRPANDMHLLSDDFQPHSSTVFVPDLDPSESVDTFVLDAKRHIRVPPSISKHLRPYQREGVKFFFERYILGRGAILGDDMGLGKTIQVIAFLSALMRKSGTVSDKERRRKRVSQLQDSQEWRDSRKLPPPDDKWPTALIIAPSSVVNVWTREFDKVFIIF